MYVKHNLIEAQEIAEKNKGICLSKEYKNTRIPLKWNCLMCNHIWYANLYNVIKGQWCKKCADNKKRYSINDCINIAKNNNGKCLESKYKQSKIPMLWECANGHQWLSPFCEVKRGSWCKKCAINKQKLTIDEIKKIAKQRNGEYLDTQYFGLYKKVKWRCANKHIWMMPVFNIKYCNSWCPECNNTQQAKLTSIIKEIYRDFNVESNFKKFDWLKTKKYGKQELDIFVYSLDRTFTLAIEYDGHQHFMPVRFGGISKEKAKENFKNTKYLDRMKNKKIHKNKQDILYFIRFNYKEKLSKNFVINKLRMEGIPV